MLSGKLLKEFTKGSYIKDELIKLAWPSLDTESKLQIISNLQDDGKNRLSDNLLTLAGNDSDAIVRFWASRYLVASNILSDVVLDHSEEAIATARKLQDDESSMVRDLANLNFKFLGGPEEPLNPQQRLLSVRFFESGNISKMMEWARDLWKQKTIGEGDIYQIVGEILRSPYLKEEFPEVMSLRSASNYYNVGDAKRIWQMSSELPKQAAREIGYYAPIWVEQSNILLEVFDELPAVTQAAAVFRREDNVNEIIEKVRETPNNYDDEVVKTIEAYDKYEFEMPSSDEIEEMRILRATDREQSLVEITIALTKQLRELREDVALLSNNQSKGFRDR